MSNVAIAATIARRTWLKTLRRPVVLTFSFAQPLIWMLFFGFLFHRYPLQLDSNISYTTFLAPGICAMTVLLGASQSGIGLIRDMQTNFLARLLGTPADHRLILGGKLLADVLRLLVQALIVLLLGVAVGAKINPAPASFVAALSALGLFAAAFASLSMFIALKTRANESMAVFVHLVNMPVLFTSSALVPGKQMPDWLQAISSWNPLTLAVDAFRAALLEGQFPSLLGCLLPLAVAALLLFLLASAAMKQAAQD